MVSIRDAMPMTGLINGTDIVQVLHSAIKFIAQRVRSGRYSGHYFATLGVGLEETDPSWAKIKHNALDWTNGKAVTNLGLTSNITQFFDNNNNRFKFFTAAGTTRWAEVQAPQLPLLQM